jgi:hypothetical protein
MVARALVVSCTLAIACGRIDFRAQHLDDAAVDVATIDAPMLCGQLPPNVTTADCAAYFAGASIGTDQQVYGCASACAWGSCRIVDASTCMTCACPAYAVATRLCHPQTGMCDAPLSGTGCIGLGFYTTAPMSCPNGQTAEGACVVRYLATHGDC